MTIITITIIIIINNNNNNNNYALVLFKNRLILSKLLYLLRTANCSGNMILLTFDDALRSGLSTIMNINLNDDQWIQASLPVRNG